MNGFQDGFVRNNSPIFNAVKLCQLCPPFKLIMFEKNIARILRIKDEITIIFMLTLFPYFIIKAN